MTDPGRPTLFGYTNDNQLVEHTRKLIKFRPPNTIRSFFRFYKIDIYSSQEEYNRVFDIITRKSSIRKEILKDVSKRTGYAEATINRYWEEQKIKWWDQEAIERWIVTKGPKKVVKLTPDGREYLYQYGASMQGRNILWQPDALPGEPPIYGKQAEFLSADEDIVLAEGGRGSGKSDILIYDTIRREKLSNPQWHGVIFRREYKRLIELIDRATLIFEKLKKQGLYSHWNGKLNRFEFRSGAWLAFHNCENLGDEDQYKGWQIADLKFDQIEEFDKSQVEALLLTNRSGDPFRLKPTMRATANPLGRYHQQVKEQYIDGFEPSKTYTITVEQDGIKYHKTYRRIHMTVFDNPLLRHDKTYIATLASHPNPVMRKAMFKGDWDAVLGQHFNFFRDAHVLPSPKTKEQELPSTWNRIGGLDYGGTKVIEFLCASPDGDIYCEWEYHSAPTKDMPGGMPAVEFAKHSAEFMLERGIGSGLMIVGDSNMWYEIGKDVGSNKIPAHLVQEVWNEKFRANGLKPPSLIPVSKRGTEQHRYRIACSEAIQSYLYYEMDAEGKISKKPRAFFFDRCPAVINALPQMKTDPKNALDFEKCDTDHPVDAYKMGFMPLHKPKSAQPVKTAQEEFQEQSARALGLAVGSDLGSYQELAPTGDWRTDW